MNGTLFLPQWFSTMRYALFITTLCYLPYLTCAPWWLLLFLLLSILYRLMSYYYGMKPVARSIRLTLIIVSLILLKAQYGSIISSNFYIGFLLLFIGLKIIEIHNERDLKVLVLCNFYLMFSALILIQELWIVSYLLIAICANLSLMLKLNAPKASLKQLGGTSLKQLLIAVPLSIVLFYLFPRIATPLWQVPSQLHSQTGFSEQMRPGSISKLFKDDRTAFRVIFKSKPLLNGYWRGLILNFYNGTSWRSTQTSKNLLPLAALDKGLNEDYEIILEPHQQKWLFYLKTPIASNPKLLFSPAYGLVNENKPIIQRFVYALHSVEGAYIPLNQLAITQNTQLPEGLNPQLKAWAKLNYLKLKQDSRAFINFLRNYINQQPFGYTLSPPVLPTSNQMDSFWFVTQQGFCEHYASAVTVILRSVGIPAHVVLGYQGGAWNAYAGYLDVQQNTAHAWVEYWQDGAGWQELDPTSFIAPSRIDQAIIEQQNERMKQQSDYNGTNLSWLQKSKLLFDSFRFFTERWLLFYNQDAQINLMQWLGLHWAMGQMLQAAIGCSILFLILIGLFYQWKKSRAVDPIMREYRLLQKEFRKFNIQITNSSTLRQQCLALIDKAPKFKGAIILFLIHYEQLRLRSLSKSNNENHKNTLKLFKLFRHKLKDG